MNIKALMEALEHEPDRISEAERAEFLEAVRGFSSLGESVYGKSDLRELNDKVKYMVEMAGKVTLLDENWFDKVTINRDLKELNSSYQVFEKTLQEMSVLRERLESAYENIGTKLNRYYDMD